jgi:pimeloyl-ACP methyl ester carboxylesterase
MRIVKPVRPAALERHHGLAYALWLPEQKPVRGGVIVLHGAGSAKESHYDFARAALPLALATLIFDQRGHGESGGVMDGRAIDDIVAMADVLRDGLGDPRAPIAVRGSSMGGYMALVAAGRVSARAVVAICPASAEGLRRGLAAERFSFAADAPSLDALLAKHDLDAAAAQLEVPVLLLHAEGDEVVPIAHSRELAQHLGHPDSRFIAVPGGHHRSIQHDDELRAASLRFITKAL